MKIQREEQENRANAAEGSGDEHVHQRLSQRSAGFTVLRLAVGTNAIRDLVRSRRVASPAAASIRYPSGVFLDLDLLTRAQRALADRHDTGPLGKSRDPDAIGPGRIISIGMNWNASSSSRMCSPMRPSSSRPSARYTRCAGTEIERDGHFRTQSQRSLPVGV